MDRWSTGLDGVTDLMADFPGELLDKEVRKLQHEGPVRSSGWPVRARNCWPGCWASEERSGRGVDQPAVRQVDEDPVIDEKVRAQDRPSDLGDPERL